MVISNEAPKNYSQDYYKENSLINKIMRLDLFLYLLLLILIFT